MVLTKLYNNIYVKGRNVQNVYVNKVYILSKRFILFKNDKIFSTDTRAVPGSRRLFL